MKRSPYSASPLDSLRDMEAALAFLYTVRKKRSKAVRRAGRRGRATQLNRKLRTLSELDQCIGRTEARIDTHRERLRATFGKPVESPALRLGTEVHKAFDAYSASVKDADSGPAETHGQAPRMGCGARLKSGGFCTRSVKEAGQRCHLHRSK